MNVRLLKTAIEKVFDSGKPVTGETLKEALESFRSVDTGGLTAPLTFLPDDHRPQSSASVYAYAPPDPDAGDAAVGRLTNAFPTRRISLQPQWLGW
jgi:hypothetical protein